MTAGCRWSAPEGGRKGSVACGLVESDGEKRASLVGMPGPCRCSRVAVPIIASVSEGDMAFKSNDIKFHVLFVMNAHKFKNNIQSTSKSCSHHF